MSRIKKAACLSVCVLAIVIVGCVHGQHRSAGAAPSISSSLPYGHEYYVLRQGLANSRARFESGEACRVAFLGGSITQMKGWRDMVTEALRQRYPDTPINFVQAGVASMGSTQGAFRLARDVFGKGPVDLLFVEAAVNDSTNGRSSVEQIRGMEGIVRHARILNPRIDIVMMHFVDPEKMAIINRGEVPEVIANHEQVAEYYGVASLNLALEVTERIRAGEFTWKEDFKDLHPAPFGQKVYYRSIMRLLDAAWRDSAPPGAYPLPPTPLDSGSYVYGRIVSITEAEHAEGFRTDPAWRPRDGTGTRPGFVNVPMLVADAPGARLRFRFEGTAAGLWIAAGADAGMIEYRIDGGPPRTQDLYTQWSKSLHLPWAYVLCAGLEPGAHTIDVRVSGAKNPASTGHAVRIAHFLVNGKS